MDREEFNCSKFASLSGHDLVSYSLRFLTQDSPVICSAEIERLVGSLPCFDEEHLVFAVEIGTIWFPDKFYTSLPNLLAHPADAVFCAALRAILHLPDKYFGPHLQGDIERILRDNSLGAQRTEDLRVTFAQKMRVWNTIRSDATSL